MATHTIDAEGKSLGRVASAAAKALLGKEGAGFARNIVSEAPVEIVNASKVVLTGAKMDTKRYKSYSGYPGGLKQPKITQIIDKKGYAEILRRAVYGMLPKNKLRARRIKQLTVLN